MQPSETVETSPRLRAPAMDDGPRVHELMKRAGGLDVNSRYFYVLMCREFAETSVVAIEADGTMSGALVGLRPPRRADTLFVWQVAIALDARGRGMGGRLLDAAVERASGVRFLEATVTPSNAASRGLFLSFARRHAVPCAVSPAVPAELLSTPDAPHEAEQLFRIGPLPE